MEAACEIQDRPLSRNAFEIAIICALPVESNAVEAMFDQKWQDKDDFGKASQDTNAYITGRIGRHNVVLACMPGMGGEASASVAASFRSSFPCIKLGLVVGICGAVPTNTAERENIMLGDVIISTGIIRYDFGRQFDHAIERKNTLQDNPGRQNSEIRSFLHNLSLFSGRDKINDRILIFLTALFENPRYKSWIRPDQIEDKLYKSTYRHKHQDATACVICARCKTETDEICEAAKTAACTELGCSDKELEHRHGTPSNISAKDSKACAGTAEQVGPCVHFGPIACGNQVMKSAHHRDRIAATENVIAFEMEGAGVWDNFPTIVIKSACDYADSHKNKKWQKYAAATAAACMKAVLYEWVSTDRLSANPSTSRKSWLSIFFIQQQHNSV